MAWLHGGEDCLPNIQIQLRPKAVSLQLPVRR
jgi:hypothetical protein